MVLNHGCYLNRKLTGYRSPEQLKPFPSMNGGRHVQVKVSVSIPSLIQTALRSQGLLALGRVLYNKKTVTVHDH